MSYDQGQLSTSLFLTLDAYGEPHLPRKNVVNLPRMMREAHFNGSSLLQVAASAYTPLPAHDLVSTDAVSMSIPNNQRIHEPFYFQDLPTITDEMQNEMNISLVQSQNVQPPPSDTGTSAYAHYLASSDAYQLPRLRTANRGVPPKRIHTILRSSLHNPRLDDWFSGLEWCWNYACNEIENVGELVYNNQLTPSTILSFFIPLLKKWGLAWSNALKTPHGNDCYHTFIEPYESQLLSNRSAQYAQGTQRVLNAIDRSLNSGQLLHVSVANVFCCWCVLPSLPADHSSLELYRKIEFQLHYYVIHASWPTHRVVEEVLTEIRSTPMNKSGVQRSMIAAPSIARPSEIPHGSYKDEDEMKYDAFGVQLEPPTSLTSSDPDRLNQVLQSTPNVGPPQSAGGVTRMNNGDIVDQKTYNVIQYGNTMDPISIKKESRTKELESYLKNGLTFDVTEGMNLVWDTIHDNIQYYSISHPARIYLTFCSNLGFLMGLGFQQFELIEDHHIVRTSNVRSMVEPSTLNVALQFLKTHFMKIGPYLECWALCVEMPNPVGHLVHQLSDEKAVKGWLQSVVRSEYFESWLKRYAVLLGSLRAKVSTALNFLKNIHADQCTVEQALGLFVTCFTMKEFKCYTDEGLTLPTFEWFDRLNHESYSFLRKAERANEEAMDKARVASDRNDKKRKKYNENAIKQTNKRIKRRDIALKQAADAYDTLSDDVLKHMQQFIKDKHPYMREALNQWHHNEIVEMFCHALEYDPFLNDHENLYQVYKDARGDASFTESAEAAIQFILTDLLQWEYFSQDGQQKTLPLLQLSSTPQRFYNTTEFRVRRTDMIYKYIEEYGDSVNFNMDLSNSDREKTNVWYPDMTTRMSNLFKDAIDETYNQFFDGFTMSELSYPYIHLDESKEPELADEEFNISYNTISNNRGFESIQHFVNTIKKQSKLYFVHNTDWDDSAFIETYVYVTVDNEPLEEDSSFLEYLLSKAYSSATSIHGPVEYESPTDSNNEDSYESDTSSFRDEYDTDVAFVELFEEPEMNIEHMKLGYFTNEHRHELLSLFKQLDAEVLRVFEVALSVLTPSPALRSIRDLDTSLLLTEERAKQIRPDRKDVINMIVKNSHDIDTMLTESKIQFDDEVKEASDQQVVFTQHTLNQNHPTVYQNIYMLAKHLHDLGVFPTLYNHILLQDIPAKVASIANSYDVQWTMNEYNITVMETLIQIETDEALEAILQKYWGTLNYPEQMMEGLENVEVQAEFLKTYMNTNMRHRILSVGIAYLFANYPLANVSQATRDFQSMLLLPIRQ